jgi:hypothetical protein
MRALTSIVSVSGLTLAATLLLGLLTAGGASTDNTWPVHGRLQGKHGKSEDVSGMACTTQQGFPRKCLVIDDNLQAAQFVTMNDGELVAGEMVPLIDDSFHGKALELDGEGVAFADGFFYVIGSHGHPRDSKHELDEQGDAEKIAARIAASSQIVRFRPAGDGTSPIVERTHKLRALIKQQRELEHHRDQRLEDNGLTIEGIAVTRGRLFAGFRGPSLEGGQALVLSVALDGLFGSAEPDPASLQASAGRRDRHP